MGLSDSGMFIGGQKSNFNQTCNLLSKYLKEKGSFEDLNLGFNVNQNFKSHGIEEAPTKTMNLLPMIEKAGHFPEFHQPMPEKSPLTIFYAGQVIVFNDFPADKAEEIMLLASRGNVNTFSNTQVESAPPPPLNMVTVTPTASASIDQPCFGINMVQENLSQRTLSTKINDLPFARKNSLTRFLEKRKDRIIARDPYQMSNKGMTTSKPALADVENKTWLGLNAAFQFPLPMDRHI